MEQVQARSGRQGQAGLRAADAGADTRARDAGGDTDAASTAAGSAVPTGTATDSGPVPFLRFPPCINPARGHRHLRQFHATRTNFMQEFLQPPTHQQVRPATGQGRLVRVVSYGDRRRRRRAVLGGEPSAASELNRPVEDNLESNKGCQGRRRRHVGNNDDEVRRENAVNNPEGHPSGERTQVQPGDIRRRTGSPGMHQLRKPAAGGQQAGKQPEVSWSWRPVLRGIYPH